jgi:hypothetical protein
MIWKRYRETESDSSAQGVPGRDRILDFFGIRKGRNAKENS